MNKKHITGTVPVNKNHLKGTYISKPPQKNLSAASKVPEFCPEIEGKPEPLGEPVVCNIATLATDISLLCLESK